MFGNKWQRRLIVISVCICVLLTGCQQLPYRDVIHRVDPEQPECAKIIDDGFDQICVVYEMMEVPVPVEVIVEVPGPVQVEVVKEIVERIVKVPVAEVKVIERIVEVPVETIVEVPVEIVREVEKIVEVPVVREVEKIVKVPVEVVREVDRIVEVPVEVIREIEKIVKVPGPVQIQIQKVNSFSGKINIPPAYEGCTSTCHAVVKNNLFVQFAVDIDGDGDVDRTVKAFEHLE